MAEVTPVWENNIPTRQGPLVSSLILMTLTWTLSWDGTTLRQIAGNSNRLARGARAKRVSNRRRHLPAAKALLEMLDQRQRHVFSPRPGGHLDTDRQPFRRSADPHRRRGPAGEVMHLRDRKSTR